jgi:hypothetical protein
MKAENAWIFYHHFPISLHKKVKVKLSRYMPWRHMEGEKV